MAQQSLAEAAGKWNMGRNGADFVMPIPIDVTLPDGKVSRFTIISRNAEHSFPLIAPGKPKGVVFNPEYAVLAYVKGLR